MRPGRVAIASLGCLLLAAGCSSSDGGSSGTGISTVQGNVASTQSAARLPRRNGTTWLAAVMRLVRLETIVVADSGVGDITLTADGTGISTKTDSAGNFVLRGSFGGPIELAFNRAEDNLAATLAVSVPKGGTLTLTNLQLDGRSGQVAADSRHIEFDGVVVNADCGQGILTVVSRAAPDDGNRYAVHLGNSAVTDEQGRSRHCADLGKGSFVHASGELRDDLGYDSESVELQSD